MPAHIDQRTGDFDQAAAANVAAIKADRAYVERTGTPGSLYDKMYYTHHLHFLVMACSMQGNSRCALKTAVAMAKHVEPSVKHMNMLEGFLAWQPFTLARFQRWSDILALPASDPALTVYSAAWHDARGLAYIAKGDLSQARGRA